ncbi:MAG: hypothetical protein JW947_07510 [Sedimentisphaerales bacterium]|nr:hypothetical protein [Sedimentisphaerales bacterium]
MKLLHKEPFEFEDKSYEVRIYSEGWKLSVRIYANGIPANGYNYCIDLPTAFDLQKIHSVDAIQKLVEIAKEDIQNKTWERYVTTYLQSMKAADKDILGCQNCASRNIVSTMVDSNKMFECQGCNNIWYERPTSGSAYEIMLDEIIMEIEKTGSSEDFTVSLLNTAFREDKAEGLSFEDQLQNWANKNKLRYNFFQKKDITGKRREAIKFYSEVPRVPPLIVA